MHSALGLSATEDAISAALVDVGDDDGSISIIEERSVQLTDAGSGAVGDAVAAAIGVMRLRAARSELPVDVVGVAYESERQRAAIERAVASQGIGGVRLVSSDSEQLDHGLDDHGLDDHGLDLATAAALWAFRDKRAFGGVDDSGIAATVVAVPTPTLTPTPPPSLASRWRNLPRSLVVATAAMTVLGGSVASAIALGALEGTQEPVARVEAAPSIESTTAPTTAAAGTSTGRAAASPASEVDETTVAYVPPARPESQAEPMPPVPEPPVSGPRPPAGAAGPERTTTGARVPSVSLPSGNTGGSGGGGGGGGAGGPGPLTTTTPGADPSDPPLPPSETSTETETETSTETEPPTTASEPSDPPPADDREGHPAP